jgi:succinate-acetate transporter protein
MSENGVNKAPLIADATPVGWMGLAVACIVAAASLLGWVSADAAVYAAAISLACLLAYGTAAVTLLKRGDAVGGCTFAYFGAFFAGGPALNYLI